MYKAKYLCCPESIISSFISVHDDWFTDKENGFYGQRDKVREYLMHWAKNGEFGPDYNDISLIYCESKFMEYVESCYDEVS